MLAYRDLPEATDSNHKTLPNTWPTSYPLAVEKDVVNAVTADWKPWWTKVKPDYSKQLKTRPIGIRSIAHALHLEFTNGWSLEFCLRFCEENLIQTSEGVSAAPTVGRLTVRGRAMVDETIASAVAIALAGADGYKFLGDLGRYTAKYPRMVSRRWKGKGPDHLVAKMGAPTDGYVAQYMFLEAKGVAGAIPTKAPRNFYAHKTQSLNADLLFGCICRPILSYVYLPVSSPPETLIAQWFNASSRPSDDLPQSKAVQTILLLRMAASQFRRIVRKSRLPDGLISAVAFGEVTNWEFQRDDAGKFWFISRDGFSAIAIDEDAPAFFSVLDAELDVLQAELLAIMPIDSANDRPIQWNGFSHLLKMLNRLRQLAPSKEDSNDVFESIQERRFEVIARDATGITFLRRALG
jgi:hypothetical protein